FQLHGGTSYLTGYGSPDFRWQVEGGAAIGILENAVQFSFEFLNDTWYLPVCRDGCEEQSALVLDGRSGVWINTATFTLSARLRI
ncbi:MAG: hypothetical protein ACOC0J_02580, partial [Myxococcota bacterium]